MLKINKCSTPFNPALPITEKLQIKPKDFRRWLLHLFTYWSSGLRSIFTVLVHVPGSATMNKDYSCHIQKDHYSLMVGSGAACTLTWEAIYRSIE